MSLMYTLEKLLYMKNKSVPVFREYDGRRGFDAWSAECRAASTRPARKAENDVLGTRGFAHVRVMQDAQARVLRDQFDTADAALRERKASAISQTITASDPKTLKAVVDQLITPAVDQVLYDYFGSEYCAYWYSFSRALPNKEPKRAFLWHCDKGPTMHAKMLFYMTSVEETGGNTYLLDRNTTERFDKAGYIFGSQKDRKDDLSEFAQKNGIAYEPFSFDMKPGEAILFLPQKVMHRGLLPTKSPRFIMQVTFLPSKRHWRDSLHQDSTMSLDELAKDYAWPNHASELRQALGG
jgi:hypothetical protein